MYEVCFVPTPDSSLLQGLLEAAESSNYGVGLSLLDSAMHAGGSSLI